MKRHDHDLDGRTPKNRVPNDAEAVERHPAAVLQGVHPNLCWARSRAHMQLFRRALGQMKRHDHELNGRTPTNRASNDAGAAEHHLAAVQQGVHPNVVSCKPGHARDHERVEPRQMGLL